MKTAGLAWLALKTNDYERTLAFWRQLTESEPIYETTDFAIFVLPNGDKIELFGPSGPHPPDFFADSPVVAGLEVHDIEAGRDDLAAAGATLLGNVEHAEPPYLEALGDRYAWQHFKTPDGRTFEILANPIRPEERQSRSKSE